MDSKRVSFVGRMMLPMFLTVVFILVICCSYFASNGQKTVHKEMPVNINPVGEITGEMLIEQSFAVTEKTVGVRILFATYSDRENAGTLHIMITGDDSGAVYIDRVVDVAELLDNAYVSFQPEDTISPENDSSCTIKITSTSVPGSAVTVWTSDPNTIPDSNLVVNGQEQNLDLTFALSVQREKTFWSWAYFLPILCIVAVGVLCVGFPCEFSVEKMKESSTRIVSKMRAFKLKGSVRPWIGFAAVIVAMLILLACILALPVQTAPLNVYRIAFMTMVAFSTFGLFFWRNVLLANPHKLFLMIALSAGLILALFAPINTGVVMDDEAHYERALHVSYLGSPKYTDGEKLMTRNVKPIDFSIVSNQRTIKLADTYHAKGTATTITSRTVSTVYGYLAYIPMAIGLFAGRCIDLSFHNTFILGRITNLLFYVLVVYFAIKICPVGKRTMMIIALFPTNIAQASNYSCDPWITALVMLWLAMLLDEIVHPERKLTFFKVLFMLGIFLLAMAPKNIYFVLGLLFLLIPKEKLPQGKQRNAFYIAVGLCILAVICNFMIPFLSGASGKGDMRGGSGVNNKGQLGFILENPLQYTCILLRFLNKYLSPQNSDSYTTNLLYMGHSSYHALLIILLTLVMVTDHSTVLDKRIYNLRNRLLVVFTVFAGVCLLSTAMYMAFTPVGVDGINGVQGRYLLPFVFPALLFMSSDRIHSKMRTETYNLLAGVVSAWVLFGSIWECCISKYFYDYL